MKLVNLKLSPKEAKADFDGPVASTEDKGPRYPYGTKIRLETDALDKLKCDLSEYTVGQRLKIEAEVEVVGISMSQRQGGKDRDELELQICDLGMEADKKQKREKARDEHLNTISKPSY